MQEEVLRALVEDVRAGRPTRRAFVARLAGLGVAAPFASALLLASAGVAQAQPRRRTSRPGAAAAGR